LQDQACSHMLPTCTVRAFLLSTPSQVLPTAHAKRTLETQYHGSCGVRAELLAKAKSTAYECARDERCKNDSICASKARTPHLICCGAGPTLTVCKTRMSANIRHLYHCYTSADYQAQIILRINDSSTNQHQTSLLLSAHTLPKSRLQKNKMWRKKKGGGALFLIINNI
jgi:hypothetical protein